MSNNLVGTIYRSIMDEVIDSSRVDFEEGGVDEGVLEALRKGWQIKLTELKIATFPWDPAPPAPAPAATTASPATQSSTASQQGGVTTHTSAQFSPQSNLQQEWGKSPTNGMPGAQNANGPQFRTEPTKPDAVIKQEPGLSSNMPPAAPSNTPQFSNMPVGSVAAQRAANHLQNQYGAVAAASIAAIQGSATSSAAQSYGQNRQGQRPVSTGPPSQAPPPQVASTQSQYALQMRQTMAQQRGPAPQHPGPGQQRPASAQQNPSQQNKNSAGQNGFQQSQVDGATDTDVLEGVLIRQNGKGKTSEMGRIDIDRMLHEQIVSRAKAMEGGGLMLPLKEATKSKSVVRKCTQSGPSNVDGGIDAEVKKEDEDETIGSDLDDPNEPPSEDDDDDIAEIMLCMYDKVQRVKNKWKCVLKDGVMNVNGKDYVFHRATGEYEW